MTNEQDGYDTLETVQDLIYSLAGADVVKEVGIDVTNEIIRLALLLDDGDPHERVMNYVETIEGASNDSLVGDVAQVVLDVYEAYVKNREPGAPQVNPP